MSRLKELWSRIKQHPMSRVGPGLITGVADDDPSGIVTYSQAGAQFGLNMLWTMPLAYPSCPPCKRSAHASVASLAEGSQTISNAVSSDRLIWCGVFITDRQHTEHCCRRCGHGRGRRARHRTRSPFDDCRLCLCITRVTDLCPLSPLCVFLKWLTLSLLAYAAVLFTVHVPWGEVFARTFWPHIAFDASTAAVVVGIFGTTISPYLFSGKRQKKSRICMPRWAMTPPPVHPSSSTIAMLSQSCAGSAGTPGAGCSTPI